MSLIQWPFKRKTYSGVNNPRFVDDIKAANEAVFDAISALTGMNGTDFAILNGLDFVAGSPANSFTGGIFYLNGVFYVMQNTFSEGLYLTGNPTDIMSVPFDGGIGSRYIYTVNYAQSTNTGSDTTTPVFNGNMNQYRIGSKYVRSAIISLLNTQAGLGTASTANLGTGTGQVLTANQTYTQTQIDTLLANYSPSQVGEVKEIVPLSSGDNSDFLAKFSGSGEGISFPWVGWHLLNGEDGYPDMTGRKFVGAGSGYVYNTPGGSKTTTLTANNIPALQTVNKFAGSGGGSIAAYSLTNTASALSSEPVNNGSPNTPISIEDQYMPVYMVYRHT